MGCIVLYCSNDQVPESGAYANPGLQPSDAAYDVIRDNNENEASCSSFHTESRAAPRSSAEPVYAAVKKEKKKMKHCLLYTSPSPRDS